MLKLFSLFFVFSLSLAQAENHVQLKKLPLGENRLPMSKNDLGIEIINPKGTKIKAYFDNNSFEWIRYDDILLIPQARLKIQVQKLNTASYIVYKNQTINFQHSKKYSYAELYVSLFESHPIIIRDAENEQITLKPFFKDPKKSNLLVDYSCSRNNIRVEGLKNEHFTIGCRTKRIGAYGQEKPMLEILWMSPELRIKGAQFLPYQAAFLSQKPISIDVENIYTKEQKTITIKASIPKRLHRLFTAYGFGPYAFETESMTEDGELLTKSEATVPALMFYINYKISETTSIRGFEAAVFKDSVFNNAGIYLGSDFGFALDNKLYFSTLIGVQYLYFQFDEDSEIISEPIFPQGIEFMYRHAFDIPNYIISGGVFLSPSETVDYQNVWIRWGKNYFWELNLISWGKEDFKATTYGVSLGFPFKGFL